MLSRCRAREEGARNRTVSTRGSTQRSFDYHLAGLLGIIFRGDHGAYRGVGERRRLARSAIDPGAIGDSLAGETEAAGRRRAAYFACRRAADIARVPGNRAAGRIAGPRSLEADREWAGEVPDSVYCEGRIGLPGEWRAVIRGYDKLVIRPQEEATRLYNLADDPGEETDLAHDREHELTRDSMLALARQWMRKLGDGVDPSGLRLRN